MQLAAVSVAGNAKAAGGPIPIWSLTKASGDTALAPAPPAARPWSLRSASARLSDTREATPRGRVEGRVAVGLGGWRRGGVVFPSPRSATLGSGNLSVLSTVHSARAQVLRGHGAPPSCPPRKRGHPSMPTPTRRHANAPSSLNLAGWVPRRSWAGKRVQRGAGCPQVLPVSGARALPKFAGRCPSPSPTRGPGGRGA